MMRIDRGAITALALLAGSTAASIVQGTALAEPIGSDSMIAFDFAGFRMFVPSADEDEILAARTPEIPPDAPADWRMPGFFFDGVIWTDGDDIASQFYNVLSARAKRSWRRFDGDDDRFPRASAMFGRANGLIWTGYGNGVVDVLPDDTLDQRHWNRLRIVLEIRDFTLEPERAFERYGAGGNAAGIERAVIERPDGGVTVTLGYRPPGLEEATNRLWLFHDASPIEGPPAEWVFARREPGKGRSFVTRIRTRAVPEPQYRFPTIPVDLVKVHASVEDVEKIHYRDYTGMGEWGLSAVTYVDADETDEVAAAPEDDEPVGSVAGRVAVGLVVVVVLVGFFILSQRVHKRRNAS